MKNTIAIVNGIVRTIDKKNSIVQAVAIENGIIKAVGTTEEIMTAIPNDTKVIDAGGKLVLPGLIESHVHVPGNAYNVLHNVSLFNAKTVEDTLEMIRKHVNDNQDKNIYYGRGFKTALFPGVESAKGPKKERLDDISDNKPIFIVDEGGHICWLNSKALEYAGITKETEDIPGGCIEKDEKTGELWGVLKDEAKKLFPEQQFSFDEKKEAYAWFQNLFLSYGYTSALCQRQSACSDPIPIFDVLFDFEKKGDLKIKYSGAREIKSVEEENKQIEDLKEMRSYYSRKSNMLKVQTAKFFLDGTVEGSNAYLLEPYLEAAGKGVDYYGDLIWKDKRLVEVFTKVLEEGFNIHIHAVGDGAVSKAIDALEIAQKKVPGDHRNCITHLQLVRDEDIKRMADLGIVACVNTYWHLKDPCIFFDGDVAILGKDRAEREYPLKSFINEGVTLTCSADYPVTPIPNPFHAMEVGVTRNMYNHEYFGVEKIRNMNDARWLLRPEERVSLLDMVKAYTINSAFAIHKEDEIGSIEVGKCGDVIILDRDIFEVDPLEIELARVLYTIANGEVVYENKK